MGEILSRQNERIILTIPDDEVNLKQLIPSDTAAYFAAVDFDRGHLSQFGDETATKYPTEQSVREGIIAPPDPNKLRFGIWDKNDFVGSINLTPKNDGSAEIGWWVGKKYIGNGYAARACRVLVRYAFEQLEKDQLYAKIKNGNIPSQKTVEQAGFRFSRTDNDEWVYILNNVSEKES